MYRCPRCFNIDQKYVAFLNGQPYCRKCIAFKKKVVRLSSNIKPLDVKPTLNYELSKEQQAISDQLVNYYHNNKNCLVHAVCGAGKTEIVLQVITVALKQGKRVGFIIPRRQVVIELYKRFKSVFPTVKVIAVYGGHNRVIDGELIVLTAHQSYLFPSFFGLVIVDEVDAFPYHNNETLKTFVEKSGTGPYVYLSATPPKEYQSNHVVTLYKRYHRHPLPEPKLIKKSVIGQLIYLMKKLEIYRKENLPCFVYLPTINDCKRLYKYYRLLHQDCYLFHSQLENKEEAEARFRSGEYKVFFATTILERGITFPSLQVIVLKSDHSLFNRANLVQIAGRVGRSAKFPDGEVTFLANKISIEMLQAKEEIALANR